MKKVILIIIILTFNNCSSEETLDNCNKIFENGINISKITKISTSNEPNYSFKEVLEINSKNQILRKIINESVVYEYNYDQCGNLINQIRIPEQVNGNDYYDFSVYDNNGFLKEHNRGTGSGYHIWIDNTNSNNPLIKKSVGGQSLYSDYDGRTWGFNNNDEPIFDGVNNFLFEQNNLLSQEFSGPNNTINEETASYSSLKNPISIIKKNTYGKRNIFFYFYDPTYPFTNKVLDISSNIFSKSTELYYDFPGSTAVTEVEVIEKFENYPIHFKLNTNVNGYVTEYIIEIR